MEKATMASSVESPVLLLGETGVGKDIIANYIHYASTSINLELIFT
jgi:transcriptional regulator with PAS, ATPase and Fis domain